jgi:hypothetical protein
MTSGRKQEEKRPLALVDIDYLAINYIARIFPPYHGARSPGR